MPCCCCCCCWCCCLDCARPWRDALCCAICGATLRGASQCCDAIIMSLRLLLEASYQISIATVSLITRGASVGLVESDNHQNEKQLRLNKLMEDRRYVPPAPPQIVERSLAIWYLLSSSFCRPPSPFFPFVSLKKGRYGRVRKSQSTKIASPSQSAPSHPKEALLKPSKRPGNTDGRAR